MEYSKVSYATALEEKDGPYVAISRIEKVSAKRLKKLSARELTVFKTKESKTDRWLTGRILAKQTLNFLLKGKGILPYTFSDISILPNNEGLPILYDRNGSNLDFIISISHSCKFTAVGIVPKCKKINFGIDLEKIRSFDPATITAFMTPFEKSFYNKTPNKQKDNLATMIWTGKESILKALGTGLRIHPNRVEIEFEENALTAKNVFFDGNKVDLDLNWTIYNRFYIIASTQLYGKSRQRHSLGSERIYCKAA